MPKEPDNHNDENISSNKVESREASFSSVAVVATVISGALLYVCHKVGESSRPVSNALSKGQQFFQPKEKARKTVAKNTLENIGAGAAQIATTAAETSKTVVGAVVDVAEEVKDGFKPK